MLSLGLENACQILLGFVVVAWQCHSKEVLDFQAPEAHKPQTLRAQIVPMGCMECAILAKQASLPLILAAHKHIFYPQGPQGQPHFERCPRPTWLHRHRLCPGSSYCWPPKITKTLPLTGGTTLHSKYIDTSTQVELRTELRTKFRVLLGKASVFGLRPSTSRV